jgi:hypothetical protein
MEDIFSIIGRLYVELLQSQKIIAELQKQLEDIKNNDQ